MSRPRTGENSRIQVRTNCFPGMNPAVIAASVCTSHKAPPKSLRSQFKQKAVLDFSHRLSQSLESGSAVLSGAFDSVKALDDRNREFTWGRLVYIYTYILQCLYVRVFELEVTKYEIAMKGYA